MMHSNPTERFVRPLFTGTLTLLFALAACGGNTATTTTSEHMDMNMEFAIGEPGDAGNADRVVDIVASDSFAFDPAELTVAAGETITFRVTNEGKVPHDFTLGDQEMQDEHETEMMEMMESGEPMMHDEANTMSLPPGETIELTWHFTQAGPVIYGCHQTGHYDAGMKGTIEVQ